MAKEKNESSKPGINVDADGIPEWSTDTDQNEGHMTSFNSKYITHFPKATPFHFDDVD